MNKEERQAYMKAYKKTPNGIKWIQRKRVNITLKRRQFISEYKLSKGCQNNNCNWKGIFNAEQLDIDHINPLNKTFSISNLQSITKLKEEFKNCQVLCANCHRTKTHTNKDHIKEIK